VSLGDRAEFSADVAFLGVGADRHRDELGAGLEFRRNLVEHRLHDRRHAGHHDHIADPEAGRARHLIGDQFGAVRDARHAQARLVQLAADLGHAFFEDFDGARMMMDFDAEGLGNAVGGYVVVRRPDAAGGEDVAIGRAHRVERVDNGVLVVGDDAYFLQVDADGGEIIGDIADVLVLGPAGQDLVADHKHGGCYESGRTGHGDLASLWAGGRPSVALLATQVSRLPVVEHLRQDRLVSAAGVAQNLGSKYLLVQPRGGESGGLHGFMPFFLGLKLAD
jgi:hypothetical protein